MTIKDISDTVLIPFFPDIKFYNSTIPKNKSRVAGVYRVGRHDVVRALGGKEQNSYNIMGLSLVLQWDTNTDEAEAKANEIYNHLKDYQDDNFLVFVVDSGAINTVLTSNTTEIVVRFDVIKREDVTNDL